MSTSRSTDDAHCTDDARGTPARSSVNTAGFNGEALTTQAPVQSLHHDLVAWLLAKLDVERLATAPEHADVENAYRRGWNQRAGALVRDVQLYVGLHELAASDVDSRFDDGGCAP